MMPKVKLVWTQDQYSEDDSRRVISEASAEFEEITDEELITLKNNLYRLPRKGNYEYMYPQIVILGEPVEVYLLSIREQLQLIEAEKEVAKKRAEKAALAKKLKKVESERAAYEKLKQKFGE